jgi:hypothetical protein
MTLPPGSVPVGPEDAEWYDPVSGLPYLYHPAVLIILSRDGDVVTIRASEDGEDLIVKDNHTLGTSL